MEPLLPSNKLTLLLCSVFCDCFSLNLEIHLQAPVKTSLQQYNVRTSTERSSDLGDQERNRLAGAD